MIGFNEPLWVPALMGVPLRWLGVSPLTILNVLSLIGLALTASCNPRARRALDGRIPGAGWSAGAVFAFSTDFVGRLAHVQAMHSYALPLALLALAKLFSPGGEKPSAAIWLALSVICAAFTSGYLAVMTVFALGGALVFGAPFLSRPHAATVVRRVAVAALITLPVLLVTMRPWWSLSRESIIEAPSIGAAVSSYWHSGATIYRSLISAPAGVPTLFPGTVALGLACVGLARRWQIGDARPFVLGVAVTGAVLSLGNLTPIYSVAATLVPPLEAVRAPLRFGQLVVLCVAVLAGFGLQQLRQRWAGGGAWRSGASIAILVLVTVDGLHAPQPLQARPAAPAIYTVLRQTAPGPLVELPLYPPPGLGFPPGAGRIDANSTYLLAQTTHWRPLVNGYGAFWPRSFGDTVRRIQTFPDEAAVDYLRSLGVRSVIDHRRSAPRPGREALERLGLVQQAEDGQRVLYRILDEEP